ncbi:MAG: DUF523 and DUF1722 domain-containing protein [Thermodesulfobacteriota bacterium]|jgi:uncharacterized protein YbgA (DUF1722 family)/uncharacterized protein YbbK (DUF523 family)
MEDKIKIGVSRCLLGDKVRYDGGHKWDRFITDTLEIYLEFVPVCPEVECGLGVPREAMHLIGDPQNPRLFTRRTKIDHTDKMKAYARKRIAELEKEDLCGFIFKSGSPSSGMERVKVYGAKGDPVKTGVGLFAREFITRFPLLPVEDDGRLHDLQLRENFIERIFTLKRWREVRAQKAGLKPLIDFHTRHKCLILSHSRKHYQQMGQLVARTDPMPLKERVDTYQTLFLEALRIKTTPKKHRDVLLHMMGFFKKELSTDEKQELLEIIDHYKNGLIPLIVPITLILHYVRKYDQPYLKNQVYLEPHPLELKLRNHV